MTNLEAAACATPVIASNSPGLCESVRDGETGFLVAHGDVAAMAAAMARISASPAVGYAAKHAAEQKQVVADAFAAKLSSGEMVLAR